MKSLFLFFVIFALALAGHIYVDDIRTLWQTKDDTSITIVLNFMLENSLQKGEVIKITWPFSINGT